MPGTISQYQVVIPGQVITATLWNGMELNIINNGLIWSGIDDYSATDAEMRIATDPFPGSVTSRPTSAQGELERIRFQLANITGKTYWYEDPDQAIPSLITSIAAVIPSGTKMAFYQASVPTGWTAVAVNDKFMRVVTGGTTGGTNGGTVAASTSLAHTHTVASHTHDLASHTHTMGNHTHSTPAHQHQLDYTVPGSTPSTGTTGAILSTNSDGSALLAGIGGGSVGGIRIFKNQTGTDGSGTSGVPSTNTTAAPSTNTSGAATPATDSQLGAFAYADFCVGTKN